MRKNEEVKIQGRPLTGVNSANARDRGNFIGNSHRRMQLINQEAPPVNIPQAKVEQPKEFHNFMNQLKNNQDMQNSVSNDSKNSKRAITSQKEDPNRQSLDQSLPSSVHSRKLGIQPS